MISDLPGWKFAAGCLVVPIAFAIGANNATLFQSLALDTLLVAAAALAVAAVTLRAVQEQILLANEQIDLARKEFKVVSEDVERNRLLFEESNKKPRLWPYGQFEQLPLPLSTPNKVFFWLRLKLRNDGQKVDLLRTVVVGLHTSLVPWVSNGALTGGWTVTNWPMSSTSPYRNFNFFKLISNEPLYRDDYIPLPGLQMHYEPKGLPYQFARCDSRTLENLLIIARVSNQLERRPSARNTYFYIRDYHSQAQEAAYVDITEPGEAINEFGFPW